ncbi:hypothetical protein [Psychroflexus sp. MES1-P1E]|uniref:hypothetical protein n=1 Tax=Psychroflexus sp. MES1-P1E TaxID=2058320 RepID=UPI000C7BA300|nr:hypothetical protein [Psychroflexus sp. MES1-P1E]PKG41664.1 hypothetical protein CXF67_14410 [Psychroflexus sp. MES1-P1E]
MNHKYSDLFYDKLNKQVKLISTDLKNRFLEHKYLDKPFYELFNKIQKEFLSEIKSSRNDTSAVELFNIYDNRSNYYDAENLNLIIDNELQSTYRGSSHAKNKFLSYEDFINHFAKVKAKDFCIREINMNDILIKMMFGIKKFDGYNHLIVFDLLKFKENRDVLYKLEDEVRKIAYPKVKVYDFRLKDKYKELFCDGDFYTFITNHFINNELNQDNFIKFFVHSKHVKQIIQFNCNTQRACFFLKILKENFYDNLTNSLIEDTSILYTKKGFPLNDNQIRSAIHRQNKKGNEIDKSFDKLISYAKI